MAKTYDTYKDSGIAWIGEIPGEWRVGLVGKYFKEINNPNINQEETNTLQFKMGEIISKSKGDSKYSPETIEAYNVVEPETIMINGLNLSFDLISQRVAQVRERGAITSTYLAIWPTNGMKSDYAKYLLKAYDNNKALHAMGRGLRATLSYRTFRSEPILIPTMEEQQSISSFLDEKSGEIDSLISIQEEMISELLAYKQSVITEAVTKGLDKKAKMKNSGVEWIGDIPEEWEVRRIKFIGDSKNGLTYTPSDVVSEHEGVLVLRSSNIQNGKLCYDDNVYVSSNIPSHLMVKKGDLIICSRNGSAALVGKCALVEEDITASFGAFMMRFQSQYNHKYIYYLLSCAITQYKQLFSTTTINQLTVGVFGSLIMPFTINETEQQAIATYLDEKTSQIDSLIALKQSKIESLKEYKKSIIYEYVTGKKRV